MIKSGHLRRLLTVAIFLSLMFGALGARLVQLQVVEHDKYQRVKEANTQRSFLREPRRGDILDVNGNPLATSLPVKRVLADPSFLREYYPIVARALAPILAYDEAKLAHMLRPTILTNQDGQPRIRSYVNMQRKVPIETWQQVTQTLAKLNFGVDESKLPKVQRQFFTALRQYGIYAKDAQVRYYPNKNLAAHVLGYVHEDETQFNDYGVYEMVGDYGVESVWDKKLSGVRGWRVTETDNRKREIPIFREQDLEPCPGLNIVLTIDMVIQNIVEKELAEAMNKFKPKSVQAVVVRPRTGEILAMATIPNFDCNEPLKSPMEHLRNRIIADMIEPGSTFKVVVVAAGLNDHLITLTDNFDCERGAWHYLGHTLHDTHRYGILPVEDIIAKSSNIGAAKIGLTRVGKERLYQYIRAFGFGTRSCIPLPGELNGWVHKLSDWDKDALLITRIPMGQSITVTHMQMAMAFSAIANGGKLMRPWLVKSLQNASGQVVAPYAPFIVCSNVITPQTAKLLTTAMKKVVSKDGTADKATLEHYTTAGKTGTAWKVENGQFVKGKYVSSFIGFFPADDPELCISVIMDEPDPKLGYYGGQVTAPVFKNIGDKVAQYLQIRPDREMDKIRPDGGKNRPERELNSADTIAANTRPVLRLNTELHQN